MSELLHVEYLQCLADEKVSVSGSHGYCSELAAGLFNPEMPNGIIDLPMTGVLGKNAEFTWVAHT